LSIGRSGASFYLFWIDFFLYTFFPTPLSIDHRGGRSCLPSPDVFPFVQGLLEVSRLIRDRDWVELSHPRHDWAGFVFFPSSSFSAVVFNQAFFVGSFFFFGLTSFFRHRILPGMLSPPPAHSCSNSLGRTPHPPLFVPVGLT